MSRPLSARRPLPWPWWLPLLAVGLVVGQTAAGWHAAATAAICAGVALSCPALWLRHRRAGTALALVAVAAGMGTAQVARSDAAREAYAAAFASGPVQLVGRIAAVRPQRARDGTGAVALDLVLTTDASPVRRGRRVRVTLWSTGREWRVGESVRGRLATLRVPRGFCNTGADGYARAMWRQGVVATGSAGSDRGWEVVDAARPWLDLEAALATARRRIAAALEHAVSDRASRAVLAALIYGDQGEIPQALRRAYARTGTAHVLSVSGLHIAVVATACFAVARRLLARWPWLAARILVVRPAALAALLPASLYALLSGGAVATLRSLVMAALSLGGVVLLRRAELWTALAAAAIVLCVLDPGVAADPSFQLSFVAVAGLVAVGRRWDAWRAASGGRWLDPSTTRGRVVGAVAGGVVAALAAGIATGPITAYHFGTIATLGVLANLVVVPLVGTLGLLTALAGTVLLPFSGAAAGALFVAASWCVGPADVFVEWLAPSRWCALDVALASPLDVACLTVPLAALAASRGPLRRGLVALACAVLLLRAGQALVVALEPVLEVRFLDVGQGDAIVVRLPGDGATVLVDGGGLAGALDPGERVVVPVLRRAGIAALDAIALTHPHFDHYGGLASVIEALPVREFWSSGRRADNATFRALSDTLDAHAILRRTLRASDRPLGAAASALRVVHPGESLHDTSDNDASLALLVTHGASRVLLTGDLQAPGESALLRASPGVAATTVKVPHHGSRTSSTRALVARVQPGLAVASLGRSNRFHFPASEVRERWRRGGARWLETGEAGEVVLRSDGQLETVTTCDQDPAVPEPSAERALLADPEVDEPVPSALAAASRASWRRALSIWLKRNASS
ncbi:MAG: DNA internalization-related competence protein ComEC/Rec2 [Candidatus Binatia bacterium]